MATKVTAAPAGAQNAGPPSSAPEPAGANGAPADAAAEPLLTLLCPPGAEGGPISHGPIGYRAYLADHRDPLSPWHVDVPKTVAWHLLGAGFKLIGPAQ
jgi:hypothetical protein